MAMETKLASRAIGFATSMENTLNWVYVTPAATSSIVKGIYLTNTTDETVVVTLFVLDISKSGQCFPILYRMDFAPRETMELPINIYLEAGDRFGGHTETAAPATPITITASIVELT